VSGCAEFVTITRREFEEFLAADVSGAWTRTVPDGSKEYVYDNDLPTDYLRIRIFSSIDRRTDASRSKGEDAIRAVIWDRRTTHPVGGRERTHRITTWRKNLRQKIGHLQTIWPRYDFDRECPECDDTLYVRDGEYGEFLGCGAYDDCGHTEPLPEGPA